MATCKHCGLEIVYETDRWSDAREGGVYDFCTERKYGERERGHEPVRAGSCRGCGQWDNIPVGSLCAACRRAEGE